MGLMGLERIDDIYGCGKWVFTWVLRRMGMGGNVKKERWGQVWAARKKCDEWARSMWGWDGEDDTHKAPCTGVDEFQDVDKGFGRSFGQPCMCRNRYQEGRYGGGMKITLHVRISVGLRLQ